MKKIQYLQLILLTLAVHPVFCQENEKDSINTPWKKIELNVGGYLTDISTEARIGSDALGVGISVDFEKALGMDASTFVLKMNGLYRFGKRNNNFVQLAYHGFNRESTKVLSVDLDFFDKIYTVGTKISSETNIRIINVGYGHSFFQTENFDVGTSIGFFVMPISLSLDAIDVNSTLVTSSDGLTFVAPLPAIGLYTNFAFSPKLIMRQNINLFFIKVGSFKGSLTELNVSLEYNAWKHLGFGLGLNSFNLNFEAQNPDDYPGIKLKGQFGYKVSGLMIYAKGYF